MIVTDPVLYGGSWVTWRADFFSSPSSLAGCTPDPADAVAADPPPASVPGPKNGRRETAGWLSSTGRTVLRRLPIPGVVGVAGFSFRGTKVSACCLNSSRHPCPGNMLTPNGLTVRDPLSRYPKSGRTSGEPFQQESAIHARNSPRRSINREAVSCSVADVFGWVL